MINCACGKPCRKGRICDSCTYKKKVAKSGRDYWSGRERAKKDALAPRPRPQFCEVCGGPDKRAMHFDHDHKTGKFRGWLCSTCNFALGHAKDSPQLLRALAAYLERTSE